MFNFQIFLIKTFYCDYILRINFSFTCNPKIVSSPHVKFCSPLLNSLKWNTKKFSVTYHTFDLRLRFFHFVFCFYKISFIIFYNFFLSFFGVFCVFLPSLWKNAFGIFDEGSNSMLGFHIHDAAVVVCCVHFTGLFLVR